MDLDQSSVGLLNLELEAGEQLLWAGKPSWLGDRIWVVTLGAAIFASLLLILPGTGGSGDIYRVQPG